MSILVRLGPETVRRRMRLQWRTMASWPKENDRNTPTRYSSMSLVGCASVMKMMSIDAPANTRMPLENVMRSPRVAICLGSSSSRARRDARTGKPSMAVFAATRRMSADTTMTTAVSTGENENTASAICPTTGCCT